MDAVSQIPADDFLDEVLSALAGPDVSALRRLELAAPSVAAPASLARFQERREGLAALLAATGRNLRILQRAANRRTTAETLFNAH